MEAILERIRSAASILEVIRLSDELVDHASRLPAGRHVAAGRSALFEAALDRADAPTAIAAAHALVALPGPEHVGLRALLGGKPWLAQHVAWSLASRPPNASLVSPLIDLLAAGRLGGMLAQRTLERWRAHLGGAMVLDLDRRLTVAADPGTRARRVETLGLVGGSSRALWRVAVDPDEPVAARIAAVAALGDRPGSDLKAIGLLASGGGDVAETARLALIDRERGPRQNPPPATGLHIVQVHLGGRLDPSLAHAGEGDTGGVATLLVGLGAALASDRRIDAITTVGRGTPADVLDSLSAQTAGHRVVAAPLARHEDASFSGAWPALLAAERGLRRILRRRPASVLHLRMADVGSLAASRVARRHGVPTIFTLAPDPHALIDEMERSGELDRAGFGAADARAALWYRARLVRHLSASADRVVLFPRPRLEARLRDLVGIDITKAPDRYRVVPEGIDIGQVARARTRAHEYSAHETSVIADLRCAIPVERRGLRLIVSVGRMTEVKGMARLVEAFAADERLRRAANLVIVGGNLADPTDDERAELQRIETLVAAHPEVAAAVVLLGHRAHDDVLTLMAVAEHGDAPWVAPDGVYACGSRKEEFGLALVEALAIGLPVVAPMVGGPATYVEDGLTGRLVDTTQPSALCAGIMGALELSEAPGRADRARDLVATRFTIGAMADSLATLYETAGRAGASVAA